MQDGVCRVSCHFCSFIGAVPVCTLVIYAKNGLNILRMYFSLFTSLRMSAAVKLVILYWLGNVCLDFV